MTLGNPHVSAIHTKGIFYGFLLLRGFPVQVGGASEATLAVTLGRPHYDESWRNYNELDTNCT